MYEALALGCTVLGPRALTPGDTQNVLGYDRAWEMRASWIISRTLLIIICDDRPKPGLSQAPWRVPGHLSSRWHRGLRGDTEEGVAVPVVFHQPAFPLRPSVTSRTCRAKQ